MHLELTCTGFSQVAINGIKELGPLSMLLCNACLDNDRRDSFIRSRTIEKTMETSKPDSLEVNDRLLGMEERLTTIVHDKVDNAVKSTYDKTEKSYAGAIAVNPKSAEAGPPGQKLSQKLRITTSESFRIQGVKEDPSKIKSENLVPTTDEAQEVLDTVVVKSQIQELRRLGTFDKSQTKPRTLLVTLATDLEARLAVAKCIEMRENPAEESLHPPSHDERKLQKKMCLKRRRELTEEGVHREKLSTT